MKNVLNLKGKSAIKHCQFTVLSLSYLTVMANIDGWKGCKVQRPNMSVMQSTIIQTNGIKMIIGKIRGMRNAKCN